MEFHDGAWYLRDFYGWDDDWYIGNVMALARAPVPEPAILFLLGFALTGLAGYRKRLSRV